MNVLITGARGAIGSRLVPHLEREHQLRLLSRQGRTDDDRWRQVDVTDLSQVVAACAGMDAVLHLAIASGHEGAYEEDSFNALRLDVNVKGTYNVFQAAARAGVQRVVYVSSLTVVWGYPPPQWVAGDAPPRPVDTYGLTKSLGEQIAEFHARQYDMSVLCLRIPAPVDLRDPSSRHTPLLPQWMAFPDLVESLARALTASFSGLRIATVVGESSRRRWDLTQAEELLGWRPRMRLEDLGYVLRAEPTDYAGVESVHTDSPGDVSHGPEEPDAMGERT